MRRTLPLILALSLLAGVISTWPLGANFFSALPYTRTPIEGYQRVPLIPGDHLQTYFWFWLLSDNLLGDSPLLTNPYEFNTAQGPLSTGYANFPWSLTYLLLLPLGPAAAYNGSLMLSFLLAGLAAYLLAASLCRDHWAALLAGVIYALAPLRVFQVVSGHLFGFIVWLLPLCLFFIEKSLSAGRHRAGWLWGLAAGACLALMGLMEAHLSYLSALTVLLYLPGRILLAPLDLDRDAPAEPARSGRDPLWPGLAAALAAGLTAGTFLWMVISRQAGLALDHPASWQPLAGSLAVVLLIWLLVAAGLDRLSGLGFARARYLCGLSLLSWLPLWIYGVQYWRNVPHLGSLLAAGCLLLWAVILGAVMWRSRPWRWPGPARILPVAAGLALGLGLAAWRLLSVKAAFFADSIAGSGRRFSEVLLYTPSPAELFSQSGGLKERFVYLGVVTLLLACVSLLALLVRRPRRPGIVVLCGLLAFAAAFLAVGARVEHFPLYRLLYDHLPFFNYPRVPGRFVLVALVFLSLAAASGLALLRRRWPGAAALFTAAALALVALDYHTLRPVGLCLVPPGQALAQAVRRNLAPGKVLLELPLWPGDSHQSSAYEFNVTRHRRPMVNGYSPVVARRYLKDVFWPLWPLNQGELRAEQMAVLRRLKVGLLSFHDDAQLYTGKISPWPPRFFLQRLAASPWLEPVTRQGNVTLFRLRQAPHGGPPASRVVSVVSAVWYARDLKGATGRLRFEPQAGGHRLLMAEGPLRAGRLVPLPAERGNVAQALPGHDRPGYLVRGPGKAVPPGRYTVRFRLRALPAGADQSLGRLEVAESQGQKPLARREISGADFPRPGRWQDLPLAFSLTRTSDLEYRVYFHGRAPLSFNLAVVSFQGQEQSGPGVWEAEDLLRQSGNIVGDWSASGGLAVGARAGYHPPLYIMHGPYRTVEPGRYRALFYLRLDPRLPSGGAVARLEAATDRGRRVWARRTVTAAILDAVSYRPLGVDFQVPFRCELDLRVRFLGQGGLRVDKVELLRRP